MADYENVIKWLEHCSKHYGFDCPQCPYFNGECTDDLMADTLALLKEHEAVKIEVKKINNSGRCGRCPNCIMELNEMDYPNYCGFCGQKVKWE